jgi:hypothetical protein
VLTAAVAVLAVVAYCLATVLADPDRDGAVAGLAGWGRCHALGPVTDLMGGRRSDPSSDCVEPGRRATSPKAAPSRLRASALPSAPAVPAVPLHAPVGTLVTPAQPGEGVFSPLVTVKGQPVLQKAILRPDRADVAFPVGVVWMRQSALRFDLHPGAAEPGGAWPVPPTITPALRPGLVAAFNGGFKVSNGDSHGGFYLRGRTVGELRTGAASEVFHRDGSLSVGVWNQDVTMAPDVVGVRQCLVPLVAHGQVTEAVSNGGVAVWGLTDGGNAFVARSGVGVDRDGDVIYVGGRLMSVGTLAVTLQRAGAVTAMMLDINLSWPSFISYDIAGRPANLVNFVRAATRYYDQSSRDFTAVYAR